MDLHLNDVDRELVAKAIVNALENDAFLDELEGDEDERLLKFVRSIDPENDFVQLCDREGAMSEEADDLCDNCMTSGVTVGRTTACGKTLGVECGCDDLDDPCDCETCQSE